MEQHEIRNKLTQLKIKKINTHNAISREMLNDEIAKLEDQLIENKFRVEMKMRKASGKPQEHNHLI